MPCGTGNIVQIVNFHIKKNTEPHYSPDNRTRIEPEQKQRDRKCPVSKAFQSLNVSNFVPSHTHFAFF